MIKTKNLFCVLVLLATCAEAKVSIQAGIASSFKIWNKNVKVKGKVPGQNNNLNQKPKLLSIAEACKDEKAGPNETIANNLVIKHLCSHFSEFDTEAAVTKNLEIVLKCIGEFSRPSSGDYGIPGLTDTQGFNSNFYTKPKVPGGPLILANSAATQAKIQRLRGILPIAIQDIQNTCDQVNTKMEAFNRYTSDPTKLRNFFLSRSLIGTAFTAKDGRLNYDPSLYTKLTQNQLENQYIVDDTQAVIIRRQLYNAEAFLQTLDEKIKNTDTLKTGLASLIELSNKTWNEADLLTEELEDREYSVKSGIVDIGAQLVALYELMDNFSMGVSVYIGFAFGESEIQETPIIIKENLAGEIALALGITDYFQLQFGVGGAKRTVCLKEYSGWSEDYRLATQLVTNPGIREHFGSGITYTGLDPSDTADHIAFYGLVEFKFIIPFSEICNFSLGIKFKGDLNGFEESLGGATKDPVNISQFNNISITAGIMFPIA